MDMTPAELEKRLAAALERRGLASAAEVAWATAWLEGCGYPGLKMLDEALSDPVRERDLQRDVVGLDLAGVSCVFLAPAIMRQVASERRVFLRNVRHGLFLLPFTVRENVAIGCPVDPAFAVGGERTKNPYAEKLAAAETSGISVDDRLLASI
ncbi:MAG: hypothetical protein KDK89_05660 [Alphaproteobacteria bacterium]|nr:hypothetical protein [Alphaproteobacteria bacterium]